MLFIFFRRVSCRNGYHLSRLLEKRRTHPVWYNWSSGGPTGSAPSDMGHAMCSNESRTITSQAVTCVVPVHSDTRSHRTSRPRLPRHLRLSIVIVSNRCCWLLPPPPLPPPLPPPGITTTKSAARHRRRRAWTSCKTVNPWNAVSSVVGRDDPSRIDLSVS